MTLQWFALNTWGKSKAEKISMMAIVMRLPTAVVIRYKACSTDFIEVGAKSRKKILIFTSDDIDNHLGCMQTPSW